MDSLRVACEENKIGNEEIEVRKSGLEADNAKIIRDYMAEYHIYSSHGKNFYDRGGSIMQKRKYLHAYNRWDDKEYDIQPVSREGTSIFWGEKAVQLAEELRKLQDVTYPHREVCIVMMN